MKRHRPICTLHLLLCNLQSKRQAIANYKLQNAKCKLRSFSLTTLIVATIVVLTASLAWACNVPVFRFALERWRPDPYQVVLLHRGPLADADREVLRPLEERQDAGRVNVAVRTVDVDQIDAAQEEDAADAALWAAVSSQGEPALPLLVVQYPTHLKIEKPVWTGSPGTEAIARLVDSPARKELARRLADGQTAVWVVLESGQSGRDEAAATVVAEEIKKLESELELPELTDAPEDAIAARASLKIEFSALRIRRDDPAEAALAAMLIGCEPDLAQRTGDTIVFPVFGRGRALWPLVGPGITAKNIRDSAGFLVGACSCEVKELNPGFDLLMAADWDELLAQGPLPLSAVQTKASAIPEKAELVPIPSGAAPADVASEIASTAAAAEWTVKSAPAPAPVAALMPRWIMVAGGGLVVLLVLVAVVVAIAGASRAREPAD